MMDTQAVKERVTTLVEQKFEAEPEFFLVDIKQAGTKLTVYIDGDNGITIGKCSIMSRYLEKYLDEELILGEKYTLDVSSPGMSNPFKVIRQYKRYIGRQIRVMTNDGEQLESGSERILVVDDDDIQRQVSQRLLTRLGYHVSCT